MEAHMDIIDGFLLEQLVISFEEILYPVAGWMH